MPDDLAPLDAYLYLEDDKSPPGIRARWLRGEELVAECMAEQGFEYLPQPLLVNEPAPDEPEQGTREFAERYGYGIFLQPRYVTNDGASDLRDVNADIKATMSLAERAEYDRALHGTGEDNFVMSGDEVDLEVTGCSGVMIDYSINGGGKSDPVYVDASAYVQHIDEVLLAEDPRVAAADARWAECMSDAGWPGLASQPDASLLAFEWLDALIAAMTEPGPEVLADEVSLALADFDCTESTGYHAIRTELRDELQQEYVDDHREELEGWLAAWAQ